MSVFHPTEGALIASQPDLPRVSRTPDEGVMMKLHRNLLDCLQKLKNLESFSNMFLNYDLLAQRKLRYACADVRAAALTRHIELNDRTRQALPVHCPGNVTSNAMASSQRPAKR
jgi:hypothetical protein